MPAFNRSLGSLLKRGCSLMNVRTYTMTSSSHPANFTVDDIGKLYKVEQNSFEILNIKKYAPKTFKGLINTLNECVFLCRAPLVEALNCMKNVSLTTPAFRVVLWGQIGTGKSLTLYQVMHYAHVEQFCIVHIPSVMRWTRLTKTHNIQLSNFKAGRVDLPECSIELLQNFKHINQPLWETLSNLKTEREYAWSKIERTEAGKPVTDIVEMGLSAPFTANDCIGALFRELRRHATNGSIKLLVAIDKANSLYGKTTLKKPDFKIATTDELTLVVQTKKFFLPNWTNGACVLVADKAEISNSRDRLTIPLNTPLEVFGEKGFDAIDPFIPIETSNYTKREANAIYDYFSEVNWITLAKTPEAKKQLFYLSASNPYNYERICSFT